MKFSRLFSVMFGLISIPSFASTSTLECIYKKYSDPVGVHVIKDGFILRFSSDPKSKKVYLLENDNSREVIKVLGADHVSFIEINDGNVTVTAVTNTMDTVHSRHIVFPGGYSLPSQFYGKCTTK
ncbi:TPA: hypothetical protein AB5E10_003468 [Vibrio cholerae]|uniref:hypothetical protein n=1 Tax=Vibrio TaxID=662 RepID=UPI000E5B9DC8|nr:hypothetical protein [Vibrio paracholerae]